MIDFRNSPESDQSALPPTGVPDQPVRSMEDVINAVEKTKNSFNGVNGLIQGLRDNYKTAGAFKFGAADSMNQTPVDVEVNKPLEERTVLPAESLFVQPANESTPPIDATITEEAQVGAGNTDTLSSSNEFPPIPEQPKILDLEKFREIKERSAEMQKLAEQLAQQAQELNKLSEEQLQLAA